MEHQIGSQTLALTEPNTPPSLEESFEEDVTSFLLEKIAEGRRVALVTLITIEGASPRPLGAQMGVSECGTARGYLSGGCLERAIVLEALAAIDAQQCRKVRYGKGSPFVDITLPCGSCLELYIDVGVSRETLEALQRAQVERHTVTTATVTGSLGSASLCLDVGETRAHRDIFFRRYLPPLNLVVAGSGASALFLVRLAHSSGLATRLYSPDYEATLPLARSYVEQAVHLKSLAGTVALEADARTAIAIMFHDHDWEPSVLQAALASEAFYIGAMGSARTHAKRVRTLYRIPNQFRNVSKSRH